MRLRNGGVSESSRRFATLMGAGRIAFGAVMVVAPGVFLRVARTPPDQINTSGRLLARMAGMRDVVLGVYVLRQLGDRDSLRNAALLNAAVDGGDALWLAASSRQENFFIAGAGGVPVAASACAAFLGLARSLD
jgi:hypothetical protein